MKRQFKRFQPFEDREDARTQYLQTNRASVTEQDTTPLAVFHRSIPPVLHKVEPGTMPLAAFHGSTPPILHKVEPDTMPLAAVHGASAVPHQKGTLSMAVQRVISTGLARLQEPQPEGLFTRGLQAAKPGASLGLLPILALTNALGLLIVSFSYYISILKYGNVALEAFFFPGLLLIFVPNLVRLLSPAPSRLERICLLCGLGICFYLVQLMISPLHFSGFDETLQWRIADDILRTGHLFSENSMLPVGSFYSGLEIVTNTVSTITGLSTFYAGILVISAARLLMILSLFLLYEELTRSSRMAGIATIIYMANPHFLFFDASFSYESLALSLATFMLYILARYEKADKYHRWVIFTAWIVLLAVTVTHHMTNFFFDGLLILWAAVNLFRTSSRNVRMHLAAIALFGVLLSFAYALSKGNPVSGYLSGYFSGAFNELGHIIAGAGTARPLFTSRGAPPAALWDRLLMLASVGLVVFGLPFGLITLRQQHRHDALAVTLGIASLAYPVAQAFRFTEFGAEIPDRSAAFLFLPIAYVLTILITHFWPTRKLSSGGTSLITCALSVVFLGGVILDSGPAYSAFPGPYVVVADGRSVEPEGIQAATWAFAYLGPGNRIGTDRINQMLMNTYGDQDVVTSLAYKIDISPVFFSAQLDPEDIAILRQTRMRYLVTDLRLSTSLPLEEFYFESSEPDAFHLSNPISRTALTKFNTVPQINRLFDSGNILIYDVGVFADGSDH